MTRFPYTRLAIARLFANLALVALPKEERGCLDLGFTFADLLKHRAFTIRPRQSDAQSTP